MKEIIIKTENNGKAVSITMERIIFGRLFVDSFRFSTETIRNEDKAIKEKVVTMHKKKVGIETSRD